MTEFVRSEYVNNYNEVLVQFSLELRRIERTAFFQFAEVVRQERIVGCLIASIF